MTSPHYYITQEQEEEEKRLEKERAEHEAYLIMKQQFSVEETGITEVFDDVCTSAYFVVPWPTLLYRGLFH